MDIQQLRKLPILKLLPENVLHKFSQIAKQENINEGVMLCREGDRAEEVIWIISGRVKTTVQFEGKEETVIRILSNADELGLFEVCEGETSIVSAQTIENVSLLRIKRDDFLQLLETHFEFQMAVFAHMSIILRGAVKEINDLKLKNTSKRLGAYLLAMSVLETGKAKIDMEFGKRLLAARLAMKPETLSRAFATLKNIGVESDRHHVHIADLDALRDFCGEDDLLDEGRMS
jgi:CRP-like cAMP-binding protein